MHVYIDSSDLMIVFPIFFGVMIAICVISLLAIFSVKKRDESKPMQTVKARILEKPVQQGNIEWYVIECEDGRRLKLRSLQANRLIISVGDIGYISYQGKTIQAFQLER